jgi:hypothetical protein
LACRMIDRALRMAIERAGAPGGIRFTERQLYFELCRVLLPLGRVPRSMPFTSTTLVPQRIFRNSLRRYGEIPDLLTTSRRIVPVGDHTTETDLFDYGLPRPLVCQDPTIADMLHANDLPMESACPVVSMAELPLDPRVLGMLALAEDPAIYLLHDADRAGLEMPPRVRELVPDQVRIVALGLRPRQAATMHLPRVRGAAPELAAINPAMLIRGVHRMVRGVRRDRPRWADLRRVKEIGFMTWPRS